LIGSDARFVDRMVRLLPTKYAKIILKKLGADANSAVAKPVKPVAEKVAEKVTEKAA